MDKYLISGAGGLLASHFQDIIPSEQAIFATKDELDITDETSVWSFINKHKGICGIINCAACRNAELLEGDAELAKRITVDGPVNLAKVANELEIPFVHYSSDYVFSGSKSTPYKEEDAADALNVYGKMKILGEQKVLEIL